MIRKKYRFDPPLTAAESHLLLRLIGWRRGASIALDRSDAVVGCIAHSDDIAEFEKKVRERNDAKLIVSRKLTVAKVGL